MPTERNKAREVGIKVNLELCTEKQLLHDSQRRTNITTNRETMPRLSCFLPPFSYIISASTAKTLPASRQVSNHNSQCALPPLPQKCVICPQMRLTTGGPVSMTRTATFYRTSTTRKWSRGCSRGSSLRSEITTPITVQSSTWDVVPAATLPAYSRHPQQT